MHKIEVGQIYSNLLMDENFQVLSVGMLSCAVVYDSDKTSPRYIENEVFLQRLNDGIFSLVKQEKPIEFIHEESFTARTNQDIPDFLTIKAHDAGESWVRRNTRVWPYDKKLSTIVTSAANEKFPRETIHTIKWFWESKGV